LGMDILAISVVIDVYITAVTRQLGTGSSMDPSRATSACAPGRRTGRPWIQQSDDDPSPTSVSPSPTLYAGIHIGKRTREVLHRTGFVLEAKMNHIVLVEGISRLSGSKQLGSASLG